MITAVIWRDVIWDSAAGAHHGHVTGHFNHMHVECSTYVECVMLGHWLELHGFRVGEHPAFGGVCTNHCHKGTAHYAGLALDCNKAGTFGMSLVEMEMIDRYVPGILHGGVSVTQLTNPNVPDIGGIDMTPEQVTTMFAKLNENNLRAADCQFRLAAVEKLVDERTTEITTKILRRPAKDEFKPELLLPAK